MANENTNRGNERLCSNSSGESRFESRLGTERIMNFKEKALAVLRDNRIDASNSIMDQIKKLEASNCTFEQKMESLKIIANIKQENPGASPREFSIDLDLQTLQT